MNDRHPSPLVQLAYDGHFTQLEEKWLQSVEAGDRDLEAYFIAADITVASGKGSVAGPLLAMLLEHLNKGQPDATIAEFAERAVLLCIHERGVRNLAADIHRKAGKPELGALLQPLESSNSETMRERVFKCLRLKPGTFVAGTVRVGPERVERFDMAALLFHLTDGKDERSLSPDAAAAELTILAPDDFRALLRFDVARLVSLAENNPADLVISALKAHKNRLEWQHLKKLLARGVVDPTSYARWWNRAKGQVDRNPMIQVYGDRQPILILRERPITHEEELTGKLKLAKTDHERFDIILGYLGSIGQGHGAEPMFLRESANLLAGIATAPATRNAVALAAASIHEDVRKHLQDEPELDAAMLLERANDLGDMTAILGDEALVGRVLEFVKAKSPDRWATIYAKTLPTAPGRLTDTIARELLAAGRGDELASAVSAILASPDRFGEGLFWLWKAATSKMLDKAPCRIDKVAITLALLRLMNRWARAAKSQTSKSQKSLLAKMRSGVSASNYKAINKALEELTDAQAVQMYAAVLDNLGLTDAARHHLAEDLKVSHKDAILGHKELWEEDVIYVSPRGLRMRQDEFNKIVNVDMTKNSQAIGEAAAFGDLSENAEFTAALEKRDFLAARANEISDELRKAAPIPNEIATDRVNVGTQITVQEEGKPSPEVIVFLGPWDASLERGIYSYLAPFSKNFLGKKVGDVIEAVNEEGVRHVKILKIERAEIPT